MSRGKAVTSCLPCASEQFPPCSLSSLFAHFGFSLPPQRSHSSYRVLVWLFVCGAPCHQKCFYPNKSRNPSACLHLGSVASCLQDPGGLGTVFSMWFYRSLSPLREVRSCVGADELEVLVLCICHLFWSGLGPFLGPLQGVHMEWAAWASPLCVWQCKGWSPCCSWIKSLYRYNQICTGKCVFLSKDLNNSIELRSGLILRMWE